VKVARCYVYKCVCLWRHHSAAHWPEDHPFCASCAPSSPGRLTGRRLSTSPLGGTTCKGHTWWGVCGVVPIRCVGTHARARACVCVCVCTVLHTGGYLANMALGRWTCLQVIRAVSAAWGRRPRYGSESRVVVPTAVLLPWPRGYCALYLGRVRVRECRWWYPVLAALGLHIRQVCTRCCGTQVPITLHALLPCWVLCRRRHITGCPAWGLARRAGIPHFGAHDNPIAA
jgi:hypothetical protein